MVTISYKVCRQDGNEFSAEASDCGFEPGYFPRHVTYEEPNGEPIEFTAVAKESDPDGDVTALVYRCAAKRRTLTIFSD